MKILLLAIALFSHTAEALDADWRHGKLMLRGPSCAGVSAATRALGEWAGKGPGECALRPVTRPDGACEQDASACAPALVRETHGQNPQHDGPNCWNLALRSAGFLPGARYVSGDELAFVLKSPLCRPLQNGEARRPGDLVRIARGSLPVDLHAYLYVNEELVFSKNGADNQASALLQDPETVFTTYKVSPECRGNTRNANCVVATSYYRCGGLDTLLKKPGLPFPLLKALGSLWDFEVHLGQLAMKGKSLRDGEADALLRGLATFQAYLQGESGLRNPRWAPGETSGFLLDLYLSRLDPIASQLDYSRQHALAVELRARHRALLQAAGAARRR